MPSFLKKLEAKPLEPLILRLLAAWCLSSAVFIFVAGGDFTNPEALGGVSLPVFLLVYAACFGLILLCGLRGGKNRAKKAKKAALQAAPAEAAPADGAPEPEPMPRAEPVKRAGGGRKALPVCFGIYSVFSVLMYSDFLFAFLLTVFWAILIFYYQKRGYLSSPDKSASEKRLKLAVWLSAAVFVLIVGGIGVFRYLAYRAPNYDFGIFAQMFHYMKTRFLPLTTCERDGLLSHFAVHVSPIYYLLLPFYFVAPSPVTLQVLQALILATAVIPLRRLCRHFGLSPRVTAVLSVLLLAYPAVAGGTNYDFHENCFLLPLLLWVFCLFEEEHYILMAIPAALTLTVKEDAAVYLLFFALFVLLERKKYGLGAILIAAAGAYFVFALFLLRTYGLGVMDGRYSNFIVNDGGLAEAVKTVLADPGYAFTQILVNKEGDVGEKVLFLLQMFVPLAFLPLCVKKVSRLLLLLPMLLLNLLTVYAYQFNIDYQYTFGVTAFVFYLCVLNLSEMTPELRQRVLLIAAVCSVLCVLVNPVKRFVTYGSAWIGNPEEVQALNAAVAELPKTAKVAANTYLVPHLSDHDELYEVYYHKPQPDEQLDYVLIDLRFNNARFVKEYEARGYRVTKTVSVKGKEILKVLEPGKAEEPASAAGTQLSPQNPVGTAENRENEQVFALSVSDFIKRYNGFCEEASDIHTLPGLDAWGKLRTPASIHYDGETEYYVYSRNEKIHSLPTVSVYTPPNDDRIQLLTLDFDDHGYEQAMFDEYGDMCFYALRVFLPDLGEETLRTLIENLNGYAYDHIRPNEEGYYSGAAPQILYTYGDVGVYPYFAVGERLHLCVTPMSPALRDAFTEQGTEIMEIKAE